MEWPQVWDNGFGVTMFLIGVGDGAFGGIYQKAGAPEGGVLSGRYDTQPSGPATPIGWVVIWPKAPHGITAWAGELNDDETLIRAQWVRPTESGDAGAWEDSREVGFDQFRRIPFPIPPSA
jgi:hypothetical protein